MAMIRLKSDLQGFGSFILDLMLESQFHRLGSDDSFSPTVEGAARFRKSLFNLRKQLCDLLLIFGLGFRRGLG